MVDKDLYKDLQLELDSHLDKINKLEAENNRLKQIIKDNELEEELDADMSLVSVEEQICIDGIKHIAELVKTHQYDDKDVRNFDTLFKVLRTIRGQSVPDNKGKSKKSIDTKELLKIVKGD